MKFLALYSIVSFLLFTTMWQLEAIGTVLFQDDFNDGDNVGWTITEGDWDASSGHNEVVGLSSALGTKLGYTYAGDPLWTDYTFDVDITFGTGDTEFYVGLRGDPTSSLTSNGGRQYLLSVDGDNDIIRLRYAIDPVGFTSVKLISYTLLDQTTYHIQVSMFGSNLQASIDGSPLFDYTFSGGEPIYSNGLIGVGYKSDEGIDGAFFDNVVVTGSQPIPEPSTFLLFSIGVLGVLSIGWRQRKKAA